MRADSLIEKEFRSHSSIFLAFTVYPIIPVLIPETRSGQSLKKGNTMNVYLLCKKFKIMYKLEERGNTIIRNKVRHQFDDINRHEIYISNSNQKVFLIPKTQKNLQPLLNYKSWLISIINEPAF